MYKVNLPVQTSTYQKVADVTARMQQGEKSSLSREYGEGVTAMACEVLRHIFGIMTVDNEYTKGTGAETQKVMDQVTEQLKKYMPWSVSLFGNERLLPVATYLMGQFTEREGQKFLQYQIDDKIALQIQNLSQAIASGDQTKIYSGFEHMTYVIDAGIDELIKKPKDMLKFNIVADKTLNGVIKVLTSLGNKRIEKTGKTAHIVTAQQYLPHFTGLIVQE